MSNCGFGVQSVWFFTNADGAADNLWGSLQHWLKLFVSSLWLITPLACTKWSFLLKGRSWTGFGVNIAKFGSSAVVRHCILCRGSVVCFFPVCCKGSLRVKRWELWMEAVGPPSTAGGGGGRWGRMRRAQQEGGKGFVSGSLASSRPGIPGNQVRLFEPACERRKHKGACIPQLMCNITALCGKQTGQRMWASVCSQEGSLSIFTLTPVAPTNRDSYGSLF